MGPQSRGGRSLPAQVSVVKKMTNIKAVFVTIGPNDLWWSRAIGLCYLADVCNDNLTTPDYQALLEKFKWNYHDLLVQLQGLTNGPGGARPIIVINGSYDVLEPGDSCAATKGLTQDKISMLTARNADLNTALQDGANLFGFKFVVPHLKTLCDNLTTTPGAEIRSPTDPDAFHPTDIGVMVMAMTDALALAA
jgi:lysophospholipase L1-like esterase